MDWFLFDKNLRHQKVKHVLYFHSFKLRYELEIFISTSLI